MIVYFIINLIYFIIINIFYVYIIVIYVKFILKIGYIYGLNFHILYIHFCFFGSILLLSCLSINVAVLMALN